MLKFVTIIGGGITGLAAAFYLQREAGARRIPVRYTLVEAGSRWGGKIITDRIREFTIEGGPDSFIVEKPAALQLCHDIGIGDQLIPSNEREKRVYVVRDGRLIPFPHGFRLTIPTKWRPFVASPLISPFGKLRMACELVIPPRREQEDESLGSFIRRRFGCECLDRIAGPLLGGIYVSDPERLSMQATFPRLLEMEREYGSLIRATRMAARNRPSAPAPLAAGKALFNSLRNGMASLVDATIRHLTGELRLNTSITRVSWDGRKPVLHSANGACWPSDAVIVATPAHHAASLLADSAPALSELLSALRCVSTATIALAYLASDVPPQRPLDGYGILIPPSEERALIAVTWSSTKFRFRAPEGCVLVRAFVGGYRDEARASEPENELLACVRSELSDLMGIRAEPLFYKLYRWQNANPQYDVGHLDRIEQIEAAVARMPGLYLAGSSYRGIGLPDCIAGARSAIDALIRYLETGA